MPTIYLLFPVQGIAVIQGWTELSLNIAKDSGKVNQTEDCIPNRLNFRLPAFGEEGVQGKVSRGIPGLLRGQLGVHEESLIEPGIVKDDQETEVLVYFQQELHKVKEPNIDMR